MADKKQRSGRPAFLLEKEALQGEIGESIHKGVDKLHNDSAPAEEDNTHNTKLLLKQYRRVAYSVQISESDLNARMEMEHGLRLSTMEVNAELAGIDLSGTKLENYAKSVLRSKNMLQIIQSALDAVRQDPDRGELMYQVLYLTYFSPVKPRNRDVILDDLARLGYPMATMTYHRHLKQAIGAIDRILWGYTAKDCMEIIKSFLP